MDVYEVDYIKIGRRIRAARTKLGWQQAEVAFRAGLTTSHMSHIETGQCCFEKGSSTYQETVSGNFTVLLFPLWA